MFDNYVFLHIQDCVKSAINVYGEIVEGEAQLLLFKK